MFTFVKIYSNQFKKYWGWYLKVETIQELYNYYKHYQCSLDGDAYIHLKLNAHKEKHLTNRQSYFMQFHLEKRLSAGNKPFRSLKEEIEYLFNLTCNGKVKYLNKGYILLINPAGSFMFLTKKWKVLKEEIKEECIFPSNQEITISKWQGGRHYYAKVGLQDVVVDGEQKWNTKAEAQRKAELFLQENHCK